MSQNIKQEKALIIGSSMAGLLAARACANHFNEVIIIERDEINASTTFRKGVAQGHQLHLLLAKGLQNLEYFFPSILERLAEKGAIIGDMGQHLKWFAEGHFRPQCETGLKTVMLSRPLLENTVREELLKLTNVQLYAGLTVERLMQFQNKITGVQTNQKIIHSDLVIDTRGMASSLNDELIRMGYGAAPVEKVKVNVSYSSCVFPKPKNFETLLNINTHAPYNTKHGTVQPIEDDRILVMLQGRKNDTAPKTEEEFKAYAAQLENKAIYDLIKDLRVSSKVFGYKIPYVRWIHFEDVQLFPEGLLPLGDAVCRLNPVYGQGMTSASIQARILDDLLGNKGMQNCWRDYFKRVSKAIKSPWELTLAEDFKFPETEGKEPYVPGIVKAYFNKLNKVMKDDELVYREFMKVLNMVAGPEILLRPRILYRVVTAKAN